MIITGQSDEFRQFQDLNESKRGTCPLFFTQYATRIIIFLDLNFLPFVRLVQKAVLVQPIFQVFVVWLGDHGAAIIAPQRAVGGTG